MILYMINSLTKYVHPSCVQSLANDHYSELSIMFGKMAMPKNRYSNIIPCESLVTAHLVVTAATGGWLLEDR